MPPVPCDLSRVYRGRLGTSRITVQLSRTGDTLQGYVHRDQDGPAVDVVGRLQDGVIALDEKTGGKFRGACVAETGALQGTYESRGKSSPVTLLARPVGEVAVHVSREETRVKGRVAPECRKIPPASFLRFLRLDPDAEDGSSDVICPGTEPDSMDEQADHFGDCVWSMAAPRVFGLADATVEKTVNGLISHDGRPYSAASVRGKVKRCTRGQQTSASGKFRLTLNTKAVLSVLLSGEFLTWPDTVHRQASPHGVTVDVQSGRGLELRDIVTDERAFTKAADACLPRWMKLRGEVEKSDFLGGRGADLHVLSWVMVPGGLAVVGVDYEGSREVLAGQGPILSYAGLLSRHLLRADSPVARLWASETPGSPDAPLCTSALGVDEIVSMP